MTLDHYLIALVRTKRGVSYKTIHLACGAIQLRYFYSYDISKFMQSGHS
ncbi:MAG: hypothetical protein ACI9N9_000505 [Enterobacterales bacterium]|jgi:hypothetical protein